MPVKILPQVSGLVWAMALDQSVLLEVLDALRNADADQSNQAGENGLSGCTPSTRSVWFLWSQLHHVSVYVETKI
jgi:hypothetical protein